MWDDNKQRNKKTKKPDNILPVMDHTFFIFKKWVICILLKADDVFTASLVITSAGYI